MKYIDYACKASWSMITTGHVEITLFFHKSIFNVDFQCLFLMLIFNVVFNNDFRCFFIIFSIIFFHNIVSAEIIFIFLNFYFLICRKKILFYFILIFIARLFFLPFFLFWLLIFFVSFQFLFFSPQKLTYFTMIMLGHHTRLLVRILSQNRYFCKIGVLRNMIRKKDWKIKFQNFAWPGTLSNRPQVAMGYKLINQMGCW